MLIIGREIFLGRSVDDDKIRWWCVKRSFDGFDDVRVHVLLAHPFRANDAFQLCRKFRFPGGILRCKPVTEIRTLLKDEFLPCLWSSDGS